MTKSAKRAAAFEPTRAAFAPDPRDLPHAPVESVAPQAPTDLYDDPDRTDFERELDDYTSRYSTPSQPLSAQQSAVVHWVDTGTGNGIVIARAGSGKTYLCSACMPYMRGNVVYLVFNRSAAEEAKSNRRIAACSNVRPMTFHSAGFSAWRKFIGPAARSIKVDDRKKFSSTLTYIETTLRTTIDPAHRAAIGQLTSLAKQSCVDLLWNRADTAVWQDIITHHDILGRIPENCLSPDELRSLIIQYARLAIDFARTVGSTLIDFDDMLWLPLVNNCDFYPNAWVVVDEAQDTNVARRMMAERMLARNGRLLAVGDDRQAIYGFTGASCEALDEIRERFDCAIMPLTTTYRCSKSATAEAQRFVPDITAHDNNHQGTVTTSTYDQFTSTTVPTLRPGDSILCRNTAPLIGLAFSLIRRGIGCYVEGRDIGQSLESLATKWKTVTTTVDLLAKLEDYRDRETANLRARDAEHLIQSLDDRIDTLIAIADGTVTVDEIKRRINDLFKNASSADSHQCRNLVTLSTVHKAKGAEWDRVFILGYYELMPSRYATQSWQQVQESNLQYVAITRAKRDLAYIDLPPKGDN